MPRSEFDVICVGGGVAGAATAAFVAQSGRRVLLIDRHLASREKACGEGLLPQGVEVLDRLGVVPSPAGVTRGIRFHLGGRSTEVPFPGGHGLAVRRLHLDHAIREAARERGATLLETRVRRVSGSVVVTDAGEYSAPVVVGADGVNSGLHRVFGCRVERNAARVGFSGHYDGVAADPRWVEVSCFPWGEFYVAPVGDGVTLVALLVDRKLGLTSNRVAELVRKELPGAANATLSGPVFAKAPLATRVRPLAGEGWLLVGDSAGAVDPITGEGMSLALLGAARAAAAIDRHLHSQAGALDGYARETAALHASMTRLTRTVLFAARHPRVGGILLNLPFAHRGLMRAAVAGEAVTAPRMVRALFGRGA